jgi:hypothetical protein
MILLGCLLALGIAFAPRVALILAWIFSDRWALVWSGGWIAPLLGIIFVPYTTVMYMLVWKPTGIEGWDWLWIVLGLFIDITHWSQGYLNRKQVPGYSTAAAAVSGGGTPAAPPATATPAAAPTVAAPPVATAPAQVPPVGAPATPPVAAPPDEAPSDTGPTGT